MARSDPRCKNAQLYDTIAFMTARDTRLAFVLPAVLVSALAISGWFDLKSFRGRQPFVGTEGRVTALDCGNHGSYLVRYVANAQTITGGAGGLQLKRDCRQLSIGQDVQVWYSANDPAYASFVDPEEVPGRIKSEIAVAIFAFYPIAAAALYLGIRFKLFTKRNPQRV